MTTLAERGQTKLPNSIAGHADVDDAFVGALRPGDAGDRASPEFLGMLEHPTFNPTTDQGGDESASARHEADQRVSIDPRPMAPELRRISSRDGSTRPIFVVTAQLFPHHLVGRLVRAQPAPTRLAQAAVGRAFAVAHFADQFRPDERHAPRVLCGKPCVEW
jgi:hypothetical protein